MQASQPERIELLDVIRGIAVLGILLMNIRLFSEPAAAYFNPNVHGNFVGIDKFWWVFQAIFADQKFMAIFSMLFGASTAIICDGLTRRKMPVLTTYAKRIFILLMIGLVHSYLLWSGDILVSYAMASFIPFLFRNVRWQFTLIISLAILAFGMISSWGAYYHFQSMPQETLRIIAEQMWQPTQDTINAEIAAHQGQWMEHFVYRLHHAWEFQTDIFLSWGIWRVSGVMLLGLALYRQGFLAGTSSTRSYGIVAIMCLTLGFVFVVTGFKQNEAANWSFPFSFFAGNLWNYVGSVLLATGYIASTGWLLKAAKFRAGFESFAAVGKTALSNYLFQTVACISIFYGFGLGLFGEVVRAQSAIVVLAVWAMQITLSRIWLNRHTKGPVEALWHKMTHARWIKR